MEYFALLIPIMALSIPIIAILTRGRRQTAPPEQERRIRQLEDRISELETTIRSMGGEVHELEDKQRFLSRLLEDRG